MLPVAEMLAGLTVAAPVLGLTWLNVAQGVKVRAEAAKTRAEIVLLRDHAAATAEQMAPNGGSSLRDQTNRIENMLVGIVSDVRALHEADRVQRQSSNDARADLCGRLTRLELRCDARHPSPQPDKPA